VIKLIRLALTQAKWSKKQTNWKGQKWP